MDQNSKRKETARMLWTFGVPMVVSAIMTKLEPCVQFGYGLSIGFILMIASAVVYHKK